MKPWMPVAVLLATAAPFAAQAATIDDLLSTFDIAAAVADPDFRFDDTEPSDTVITGEVEGEPITITLLDGATAGDAEDRNELRVIANGDELTFRTDAPSFNSTTEDSITTVTGVIQGAPVDGELRGDLSAVPDAQTLSGVLNGQVIEVDFGPGGDIENIDPDTTLVTIIDSSGDVVFTGTLEEVQEDPTVQAIVANSLGLVNPVTNIGFEAQDGVQSHGLRAVAARIGSVLAPVDRATRATPEGAAGSSSKTPQLRFGPDNRSFGAWTEIGHIRAENRNPIFRSRGSTYGVRLGADMLVDETLLVGFVLGYDAYDGEAGASFSDSLDVDAWSAGVYGGASLMEGDLTTEASVHFALMSADTVQDGGPVIGAVTGETDGVSVFGHAGATYWLRPRDNLRFGAQAGGELGYTRYDPFVDSLGATVDEAEAVRGRVYAGAIAKTEVAEDVTIFGEARGYLDVRDQLTANPVVRDLNGDHIRLRAGVEAKAAERMRIAIEGTSIVGHENRRAYGVSARLSIGF